MRVERVEVWWVSLPLLEPWDDRVLTDPGLLDGWPVEHAVVDAP